MRWSRLLAGLGVIFALLLVLAWIAGGRGPMREIVQPIPVPEVSQ